MPPTANRRIVLTTFGSLGDLHPFLAIASELQQRGYDPVVATVEKYRDKVEAAGFGFRLLRTAFVDQPDRDLIRKIFHVRRGNEFLIRHLLMPALRTAYQDTLEAVDGAALLVSHPLTYSTRLAAEVRGIPWVSTQLAPLSFLSPFDPPVLPVAPFLTRLRPLGPAFFRPLFALATRSIAPWTAPYRELRAELGLQPIADPLLQGSHSPTRVLALFPELFAARQRDWPAQAVSTGFPFYDLDPERVMPPGLASFLDAGEPPIVFTLGSSAVLDAGRFYQQSAAAAQRLGRRAVLLTGTDPANRPANLPADLPAALSAPIAVFDYAPFSLLFPRAAAIVHQGGIGTTSEAMRSGRPMLVMPYAFDQPDNADRVVRLGIARTVPRTRYSTERATAELEKLLTNPEYRDKASQIGATLSTQNGAANACDHLEALMH